MIKIEAIVRNSVLHEIQDELAKIGIPTFSSYQVQITGIHKCHEGLKNKTSDFIPKTKIEILCKDEDEWKIIDTIQKAASTGEKGDGVIFTYQIEKLMKKNEENFSKFSFYSENLKLLLKNIITYFKEYNKNTIPKITSFLEENKFIIKNTEKNLKKNSWLHLTYIDIKVAAFLFDIMPLGVWVWIGSTQDNYNVWVKEKKGGKKEKREGEKEKEEGGKEMEKIMAKNLVCGPFFANIRNFWVGSWWLKFFFKYMDENKKIYKKKNMLMMITTKKN